MQVYFGLITQKEVVAVSEMRKDMGRTGRCGVEGGYHESDVGYAELKCLLAAHMNFSRNHLNMKW